MLGSLSNLLKDKDAVNIHENVDPVIISLASDDEDEETILDGIMD